MKYLKTYEHLISNTILPQIGEYVICNPDYKNANQEYANKINNFLISNIGQILELDNIHGPNFEPFFHVYYQNVPGDMSNSFGYHSKYRDSPFYMNFNQEQIIYHSTIKENLEPFIQANKYNL